MDLITTQKAIKLVKDTFEKQLAIELDLIRVSAPLFVDKNSGLNDNLNGYERAVGFDILQTGVQAEVVHSLAKWKRLALKQYGFAMHKGLYTDMNAIRRDERCDALHSLYVDQWDWEKVISSADRNVEYLKSTVLSIYSALKKTAEILHREYKGLKNYLSDTVTFVTTQQLEDKYPNLSPSDRETAFVKENGSAFIMGIGGKLRSGSKHDGRAPDYDDWTLNGDLVLYYPVLDRAFELSSMGIRVDAAALTRQLSDAGLTERAVLPYHKSLLEGELPLTIGGGIGQSRLCMYLLGRAHIGEVQASIWPDGERDSCAKKGIILL
ncbi:MAG: aspartate--ammonia ligase [Clostridia bacterium]|nr:aspartate--ammonia ligase [Clostridia bacterium]